MIYALVTNGGIARVGPRPKWLIDGDTPGDSRPLSDEELATHGWLPVIDEPPHYDPVKQWLERNGEDGWLIDGAAVRVTYAIHDRDPAEVALAMTQAIDAERDRRIAAGFIFQSKGYQSRPEDRENMAGASLAALAAMGNGALPGDYRWHGGDSDFVWIAEDNSLTLMDAQTMFALGQTAMAHKQAHIFAARALKDADPIPADYADDIHWPATGE